MCHHWAYDSVEERLAEREADAEETEPEPAVELDREYDEDERDPAEIPTADDD